MLAARESGRSNDSLKLPPAVRVDVPPSLLPVLEASGVRMRHESVRVRLHPLGAAVAPRCKANESLEFYLADDAVAALLTGELCCRVLALLLEPPALTTEAPDARSRRATPPRDARPLPFLARVDGASRKAFWDRSAALLADGLGLRLAAPRRELLLCGDAEASLRLMAQVCTHVTAGNGAARAGARVGQCRWLPEGTDARATATIVAGPPSAVSQQPSPLGARALPRAAKNSGANAPSLSTEEEGGAEKEEDGTPETEALPRQRRRRAPRQQQSSHAPAESDAATAAALQTLMRLQQRQQDELVQSVVDTQRMLHALLAAEQGGGVATTDVDVGRTSAAPTRRRLTAIPKPDAAPPATPAATTAPTLVEAPLSTAAVDIDAALAAVPLRVRNVGASRRHLGDATGGLPRGNAVPAPSVVSDAAAVALPPAELDAAVAQRLALRRKERALGGTHAGLPPNDSNISMASASCTSIDRVRSNIGGYSATVPLERVAVPVQTFARAWRSRLLAGRCRATRRAAALRLQAALLLFTRRMQRKRFVHCNGFVGFVAQACTRCRPILAALETRVFAEPLLSNSRVRAYTRLVPASASHDACRAAAMRIAPIPEAPLVPLRPRPLLAVQAAGRAALSALLAVKRQCLLEQRRPPPPPPPPPWLPSVVLVQRLLMARESEYQRLVRQREVLDFALNGLLTALLRLRYVRRLRSRPLLIGEVRFATQPQNEGRCLAVIAAFADRFRASHERRDNGKEALPTFEESCRPVTFEEAAPYQRLLCLQCGLWLENRREARASSNAAASVATPETCQPPTASHANAAVAAL